MFHHILLISNNIYVLDRRFLFPRSRNDAAAILHVGGQAVVGALERGERFDAAS
jgi:hypothetical protein